MLLLVLHCAPKLFRRGASSVQLLLDFPPCNASVNILLQYDHTPCDKSTIGFTLMGIVFLNSSSSWIRGEIHSYETVKGVNRSRSHLYYPCWEDLRFSTLIDCQMALNPRLAIAFGHLVCDKNLLGHYPNIIYLPSKIGHLLWHLAFSRGIRRQGYLDLYFS